MARNARNIEKIFSECIERVERGESIENCLRSYPEYAFELEPLLRTALGVKSAASRFEPRPYFKTLAHARLDGAQRYARYAQKSETYPIWQRAWVPALAAVTAVLFIGVGTVAASSHALPKEALYPVKMATEKVRVAFTFSDVEKAKLHVELAEERSDEIAAMAARGNTDQIMKTTDRLVAHLEEANTAIVKVTEDIGVYTTADVETVPAEPEIVEPSTPAPSREQPVVEPEPEPAPEPEQIVAEPEPEPAPEPEQTAAEPEPEPAPEPEQAAAEPKPEPAPEPEQAAAEPEPEPAPEPEQAAVEPEPEPTPEQAAVEPEPEQPAKDTETEPVQEQTAGEQTVQTAAELAKILEFEQLRKTMDVSLTKNVAVLENALGETPDELKPVLQHAIDLSNKLKTETRNRPAFNLNNGTSSGTLKKKNNIQNIGQNTEQNTEQNKEQNAEQNTEQNKQKNNEQNTKQNTEQNAEQNNEQNSEQDTGQNGQQNTDENTGQNNVTDPHNKQGPQSTKNK